MRIPGNVSLLKSLRSFRYGFNGIWLVFKNENNAKVHFIISVLAIATGLLLNINKQEWLWIALCITLVWVAEAFNSSMEKLTDLISPEHHPVAGAVKDMSAGAVLLTAMFAFISGLSIFIPHIFNAFSY